MANRPSHGPVFPESKKYVCRHCMQHFDDPKTRWRHSKWCIPKDSSTGRKLLDREMRPLNVAVTTRPAEPVNLETVRTRNLKSLAGPGLSCFICFKVFADVEEMKVHVRNPCNKEPTFNEDESEILKKVPPSKRVPVPGESGLLNYKSVYDQNTTFCPSVAMDTSMDVAMDVVIENDGITRTEKGAISSSKKQSKVSKEPVDNGTPASTATCFTALTTRKRKQNPSPGRWSYLAESDRPSRPPKDPSKTTISFVNLAKVKPSLKSDIDPSTPSPKPNSKKVRWHSSVDDAMYEPPKSWTRNDNQVMTQASTNVSQRAPVSESEGQITSAPESSEKQSEISKDGEIRSDDGGIQGDVNQNPLSEAVAESEPVVSESQDIEKPEDRQSHYTGIRPAKDLINNEEYDKIIRGIHEAKQEKIFDPDPYDYYLPPKRRKKVTSRGAGKCKLVYPKEIVKPVKDDYLPGEKIVVRKPNFLQQNSKPVDQDRSLKKKKKNKRKKKLTVEDLLEDDFDLSDVERSDLDIHPEKSIQENTKLSDAAASDDISTSVKCDCTVTNSKSKKMKDKNTHSSKFKCCMDHGAKKPKFKLVIKALGSKIKLQSSSIAKKKLEKSLKERAALKMETTKPHRCRICTRIFKSAQLLVKHSQMPCMIQHTRNMCQKVLRPKKSGDDNSSCKKIFSKTLHLLDSAVSRRIYEPSKNYKRNSKNDFPGKYGRMLTCQPSKVHPQHLLVYIELSEKEQFFYSLDLILMEKMELVEAEQKQSSLEKPLSSVGQDSEPEMPPLIPISGEMLLENDEELPPLLEPMDCFDGSHLEGPLLSMQQLPDDDLGPPVLEQIVSIERTNIFDGAADTEMLDHSNGENATQIKDGPTTELASSKEKSTVLGFDLNKGLNVLRNKCLLIFSKGADVELIKIDEKSPESPDFEPPTIVEASNVSDEHADKVCPPVVKSVLTIKEKHNSTDVQSESKADASISPIKREKTRNVFESLSEWCQADTSEERTNMKVDENTEELKVSSVEDYVEKTSFDDAIADADNMDSLPGKEIPAPNASPDIRESSDDMKSTFASETSAVDAIIDVDQYHLDEYQYPSAGNAILRNRRSSTELKGNQDDDAETKLISNDENEDEDKFATISIDNSCQEDELIGDSRSTFARSEISAPSVNEALTRNETVEVIIKLDAGEGSAETNSTPSENHSQLESTIDAEHSEEIVLSKSLSSKETSDDITSFDVSKRGTNEDVVKNPCGVQSLSTSEENTSFDLNMETSEETPIVVQADGDSSNKTDEVTISSPSKVESLAKTTGFDIEDNSVETKSMNIRETSLPKLIGDTNINSNELESISVSVDEIGTENTSFGNNECTVEIKPTSSHESFSSEFAVETSIDVDQKSDEIAFTSESNKEINFSVFGDNQSSNIISDDIFVSNACNTVTTEKEMNTSNGTEKLKSKSSTSLDNSEESISSNAESVGKVSNSDQWAANVSNTEKTHNSDQQSVHMQHSMTFDDISIVERCIKLYACQPSVPKLKKAIICLEDICLKGVFKQRMASSGSLKESNESGNKASRVGDDPAHTLEQKPNLKLTIYRSKNIFSLKQNEPVLAKAATMTSSQEDLVETEFIENDPANKIPKFIIHSSSSNKKRLKRHHHEHNKGEKHHRHRHKSKVEAVCDIGIVEHPVCEDVDNATTLSDSVSSEVSRINENIKTTTAADEKEENSSLLKPDICEQDALENVAMLPIPEDQHSIAADDTGIVVVNKDEDTPYHKSGIAAEILHESSDAVMQLDTMRQIFEDDAYTSKIDEIESYAVKDNDNMDEIEPNVVKDDQNLVEIEPNVVKDENLVQIASNVAKDNENLVEIEQNVMKDNENMEQKLCSSPFIVYPESWSAVGPIDGPSFHALHRLPISEDAVYEDISEDDSLDYVVYQNISGDENECQQPISDMKGEPQKQSSVQASISGNVTEDSTPMHLSPKCDDSERVLSDQRPETQFKLPVNEFETEQHLSNKDKVVEENVSESTEHSNSVVGQSVSENAYHFPMEDDGLYQNISDDENEIQQSLFDAKCELSEDFSKVESEFHNISEDGSLQQQQFLHKSKNTETELPDTGSETQLSSCESYSHISEEESELHNHSNDTSSQQRQLSNDGNDSETRISDKGTEAMCDRQQNRSNETTASEFSGLQRINSSEQTNNGRETVLTNQTDFAVEMQERELGDTNVAKSPEFKETDSDSFDKFEGTAENIIYAMPVTDALCSVVQSDEKGDEFLTKSDEDTNTDNVHAETVYHQHLQSDSKIVDLDDSLRLQGEQNSVNKEHPDQIVASKHCETENRLSPCSDRAQNTDCNKSETDDTKESVHDDGAETEGNITFNQFKWGIDMEYDSISECDFEETENHATFEAQQTSDIGNVIDDSEFKASLSESVNFGFSI